MGQYWLEADSQPLSDPMSGYGFESSESNSPIVVEFLTGRHSWDIRGAFGRKRKEVFTDTDLAASNDHEILIVQDYTANEINNSSYFIGYGAVVRTPDRLVASPGLTYYAAAKTSLLTDTKLFNGGGFDSITKNDAPSWSASLATAMRVQIIGTTFRARVWQAAVGGLEAAEPSTWNFEATDADLVNGYVGLYIDNDGSNQRHHVTAIGIGIGTGNAAPFGTPPDPYVAPPTALSTANTDATSTDASWS